MEVILASRSPRRLDLLQSAGLDVDVRPSHIDETPLPDEGVEAMVMRLSRAKAEACVGAGAVPVIAADTLVAVDGLIMGQAADLQQARQMLLRLSGREHEVITGVCVRLGDSFACGLVRTSIRFRALGAPEVDAYLAHNDVLDKSGSYAVQGPAASFIDGVNGPLDNVIGLPVQTTLKLIEQARNAA
jgi:septum formation protein